MLTQWHVQPDNLRAFDPELAKQKLDAAGYPLDSSGNRLDKQGKRITLRISMPNSDDLYPKAAQFVAAWYEALGIKTTTQVLDSGTLGDNVLPPEAGKKYKADYDIELWGWSWGVDPGEPLGVFLCDAIGSSSDSQYCNPAFDKLNKDQLNAQSADERHALLAQAQNLIYDEAPYDILYYDANLDVYRTDRFAGWTNQPSNGTPMFTYSTLGYTKLTDATIASPEPTEAAPSSSTEGSAAPGTPVPTASGDGGAPAPAADNTPLMIGIVALVAVIAVGLGLSRRRKTAGVDDEDE